MKFNYKSQLILMQYFPHELFYNNHFQITLYYNYFFFDAKVNFQLKYL